MTSGSNGLEGRANGRRVWRIARNLSFLIAALLAYNGARILDDSPKLSQPFLENFDEGILWIGLALLALLVATLPEGRPSVDWRSWPRAAVAYCRTHPIEVALFVGILAFGVFMRLYRFQGTLPPSDGLCCEEHINGGVAYTALLGDRPLNFLITRWGAAGGILLFGENTLGLRFFFPLMSITTLVAFYFLLRRLVSIPVALFGYALLAAAWWPSLRARQATEGMIYAVLFALVLIVVLRTKRPIWAFAAGVLAGLLSYEYEPFKAVPIIAAIFLGCAAAREILLRAPLSLDGARARTRDLIATGARPLLIALMATGIVLIPMIVGTHKGYDLYLTSVHRQESGREGDRIADNWRSQLKWAAQVFLPVGPNDYAASPPRDVADTDLIDPVVAWLGLAGLTASLVLLLRGVRALFVLWAVITVGASAVLLGGFGPWKFMVLVPVIIALAALFVEDVWRWLSKRWPRIDVRGFYTALALLAAFSMWWNADTLFNEVGPSGAVQAGYGGEASLLYSVCKDLKDGEDSYVFASSGTQSLTRALASPHATEGEEARAWGDLVWACNEIDGQAVAAPEELWPIRGAPGGPIALVATDPPSIDELTGLLSRVYTALPAPTVQAGPADTYRYVIYKAPDSGAIVAPGLWATYTGLPAEEPGVAGVPAPVSQVDDLSDLSWEETPPPIRPPFEVTWRGLIYTPGEMTGSLQLTGLSSATVIVDGQETYRVQSGQAAVVMPVEVVSGWHVVEIIAQQVNREGEAQLTWVKSDGTESAVESQDLFPVATIEGWIQKRTVALPGGAEPTVTQRLDFEPHYVSAETIVLLATRPDYEPRLAEERWRGVWQVDEAADYTLRVEFRAGQTTLLVDGAPVAESQDIGSNAGSMEANVTLSPGPHVVEIVQAISASTTQAGATIAALRGGQPVDMRVAPY